MLTRRQGRVVGVVSLATSALCFYRAATAKAGDFDWRTVAAAVGSLGFGYFMVTKLYMSDPSAVAEYRADVDRQPLPEAIKRYGLKNIVSMAGREYVRKRIATEYGTESLAKILVGLGAATVKQLPALSVMTQDEISRTAAIDVSRAMTFTSLWRTYAAVPGGLDAAWGLRAFDMVTVRRLLLSEFGWADETGKPKSCGTVAGETQPALSAAVMFGEWTRDTLSLPPAYWQAILRLSPEGERLPFSELTGMGLLLLHKQRLIDADWARGKFDADPAVHGWDVWQLEHHAGSVNELVLTELLRQDQLQPHFERSVPLNAAEYERTPRMCVIEFMKHFEPLFKRFPQLAPPRFAKAMSSAKRRYDKAVALKDGSIAAAKKELADLERVVSADKDMAKDRKAVLLRQAKEAHDASVARSAEVLLQEQEDTHREFARVCLKHQGGGPCSQM